ncbi:MAG: NBR1-Ig-like domain-containing protein [Anaerolineae bacterium]|nr:NBR1-Ig-like domain-containing protein [Anaerolineae bacterium]
MGTQTGINGAHSPGFSTLDDLDQLPAGAPFAVTWIMHNSGASTWTDAYQLVFTDESHPDTLDYPHMPLTRGLSHTLADLGAPATVPPDARVHLTLTFTAPAEPGTYVTAWQLQAPNGERFGPVCSARVIVPPLLEAVAVFDYKQSRPFFNSYAHYNAMPVGQQFSGNWELQNTGLEAWRGDFRVVAVDDATPDTTQALRSRMGFSDSAALRELTGRGTIAPGESVSIRLDLQAPQAPGIYAFHWHLRTAEGTPFGGTRWLKIGVVAAGKTAPPDPIDVIAYTPSGPGVTFFTGIHGPAEDYLWQDGRFLAMMQQLAMPIFFWSGGDNSRFAHLGDPARNAVRLYWNPRPVSADHAYEEIRDDQLRNWWERGYRRFVFFNEPQLGIDVAKIEEGMGIAWHSKDQFARFLAQCLRRARRDFPGIQLFTTPMSSHGAFDPWGWRGAMWEHVRGLVDGWCMHAYSGDNVDAEAAAQDIADQVIRLQRTYQLNIPIIVSEASVNRGNDAAQKARVAHRVAQKLAQVHGVEGVFWFAADWNPAYDIHHEGWFRNGIATAYLQQRV